MTHNRFIISLAVFLLSIFIYTCGSSKTHQTSFCGKYLDFQDNKISIRKIDTLNYEEGDIHNITTNDSCSILILCGGNTSLLGSEKYVVKDSTYIKGSLSLKGIDDETKLYWRKYKNIAYIGVKEKDTLRYSRLLNNVSSD